MQTALSSKRSWIARIAVLAMVASLMAIAAPAGAAIDTSDACPDAIPSAGFTDLAGVPATAVDAIDCIAFYEISTGTSATTFDPFADVARWQMALFLTRQAEVHGVTLPDGSDQGFNDLAGVPAAAVTAINQTAQLNISDGTSATTFDPFADVERWQMALFLTRLIDAAGVTLPAGADQGFTDLAGVPATAVTAINQLGELDIADGTTATTYDPFASVERWAMALFLTRTLAADGVTPDLTNQDFAVSPQEDVVLTIATPDDTTDDRVYTVSNAVAGEVHQITLALAANVSVSAGGSVTFEEAGTTNRALFGAVDADITTVNGVPVGAGADATASITPTGTSFDFRVDGDTDETIVPVVWFDADEDGFLDLNADDTPVDAELVGVGGEINYNPAEAAAGDLANDAAITEVDKDNNMVVTDQGTFAWDSNDIFYIYAGTDGDEAAPGPLDNANRVTMAEFEAELSVGDELDDDSSYFRVDEFSSVFVLEDITPLAPTGLAASGTTATSTTLTVSGVASGATSVTIRGVVDPFTDTAPADGIDDVDEPVTATSTVYATSTSDANTTLAGWQVVVSGLTAETIYDFAATQTVDGETSGLSPEVSVETLAVGETTAPTIVDLLLNTDAGTAGLLDSGDIIDFEFSEEMQAPTTSWLFRINDADSVYQVSGTVATPALFDADSSTDAADGHRITLTGAPIFISGVANGIDLLDTNTVIAVQGFRDLAGNSVDLAGSADTVVD